MSKCIKDVVLRLYYDEKIFNAAKIARKLGINPRTAQKYISKDPRYEKAKQERKTKRKQRSKKAAYRCVKQKRKEEKEKENDLVNVFFENTTIHDCWGIHTEKKLAEKMGMELKIIIKILKKNSRYKRLIKHRKISTVSNIDVMHEQDVKAMSKNTQVTNKDYLDLCSSVYRLSPSKKYYIFDERFGKRPSNMPARIATREYNPFYEKERVESEKFLSTTEKAAIN